MRKECCTEQPAQQLIINIIVGVQVKINPRDCCWRGGWASLEHMPVPSSIHPPSPPFSHNTAPSSQLIPIGRVHEIRWTSFDVKQQLRASSGFLEICYIYLCDLMPTRGLNATKQLV